MKRLTKEIALTGLHFLWWLDYRIDPRGACREL